MNSERRLLSSALPSEARSTGRAHEDSAGQVPARIKANAPCSGYWASRCCRVTGLERQTLILTVERTCIYRIAHSS